jgi:protein-S-isoprenylcysteine O-methyltransferase Ste14
MKRDNCVALAFVLAALFVMGISWLTRSSLPISRSWGKLLGEVIFIFGMAIFVWATVFLREAFRGTVAPVSDQLVQIGPYRWVRHPLYLSMILILIGISIALRSLWGLVGVFALFTPIAIFRARREEEALVKIFKEVWSSYAAQTKLLVPFVW